VTLPVVFSTTDHAGAKSLRMFRVQNGKWVAITDFISAK